MNCLRLFCIVAAASLFLSSCIRPDEKPKVETVEVDYNFVVRLDYMYVYRGIAPSHNTGEDTSYLFIPQRCKFTSEQVLDGTQQRLINQWTKEANSFYGADLRYKGIQYYVAVHMLTVSYSKVLIGAYDWRARSLDVIALTDWDAEHPAGSSVKDKFCLMYRQSDRLITVPLTSFKYSDLLFSDNMPVSSHLWPVQPSCNGGLVLRLINPLDRSHYETTALEVRMQTDFGTQYCARASDTELQAGLNNLDRFTY